MARPILRIVVCEDMHRIVALSDKAVEQALCDRILYLLALAAGTVKVK